MSTPDGGAGGYRGSVATGEVNNPIFARLFDRFLGRDKGRGEDDLRRELLAGLSGRVVEVGCGNGINFEHLPTRVDELVAVEPEPYLRRAAQATALEAPVPTRVIEGTADALPLETDGFDAVAVAGVLCSVPDQRAALAEFARVLRPGGELRFYEHVRSSRPGFARFQDTADFVWPRLFGGCHPNRDTLATITAAGFRIERCRGFGFPDNARAYPVAPRILGIARL
jgi:ubiquinone/menaquinone biosynthesis C-methylase UbiE